jgi:hypothetical protein
MVYCRGQASISIDVSEVMQELLISDISNGDYTRATCRVGLIHPCCHPQSKVVKLASTNQYHMVFINGTEKHDGYNDFWQLLVTHQSFATSVIHESTFKMDVFLSCTNVVLCGCHVLQVYLVTSYNGCECTYNFFPGTTKLP